MSWLNQTVGGEAPERYVEPATTRMVKDPAIPNRMVSNKSANRPFLAYKAYRERQEALHNAWVKKKEERDAAIARGEKVGPLERDPTVPQEVGLLGLLKFISCLLICISLAGKFITGSYTWEYRNKWTSLLAQWPGPDQLLFSEGHLADFDGRTSGKPIYLAIDGDVYDVSKGSAYQPGGSYHIFAGVDAARAFGTGCFKEHRMHDKRGMTDQELQSLDHWKNFYAEHKVYRKVGRVSHPTIDPASPIPPHCKGEGANEKPAIGSQENPTAKQVQHEEL